LKSKPFRLEYLYYFPSNIQQFGDDESILLFLYIDVCEANWCAVSKFNYICSRRYSCILYRYSSRQ